MKISLKSTTAIAITLAAGLAATTAAAETTLRLSTYVNEADIRYEGFTHFADLVAEKTGGSVKVEIFPSATLHGWSEGVDAVQGGVSDISWINADNRVPCVIGGDGEYRRAAARGQCGIDHGSRRQHQSEFFRQRLQATQGFSVDQPQQVTAALGGLEHFLRCHEDRLAAPGLDHHADQRPD